MADEPLSPDDELEPDDEPLPEEENPDDEPPPEDDPDADPPADDEPPADEPRGRGRPDASQAAARRSREARLQERIERLERERTAAPRQNVDPEAQRRARDAALDQARLEGPEAVAQFYARESEQRIAFANFQTQDRIDQAEFRALCREDRAVAAVKDRVEEIIQTARTNGNFNLTREQAATYALGELARRGAATRGERQRSADATRRRETVNPPRARSDAPQPRRRRSEAEWSAEDYEREIGNQPIR